MTVQWVWYKYPDSFSPFVLEDCIHDSSIKVFSIFFDISKDFSKISISIIVSFLHHDDDADLIITLKEDCERSTWGRSQYSGTQNFGKSMKISILFYFPVPSDQNPIFGVTNFISQPKKRKKYSVQKVWNRKLVYLISCRLLLYMYLCCTKIFLMQYFEAFLCGVLPKFHSCHSVVFLMTLKYFFLLNFDS